MLQPYLPPTPRIQNMSSFLCTSLSMIAGEGGLHGILVTRRQELRAFSVTIGSRCLTGMVQTPKLP